MINNSGKSCQEIPDIQMTNYMDQLDSLKKMTVALRARMRQQECLNSIANQSHTRRSKPTNTNYRTVMVCFYEYAQAALKAGCIALDCRATAA